MRSDTDLSTSARIRDAAISLFAEHGVSGTSARKVAAAADVSPALVMHHFGSMEGLRRACDEHVVAAIRRVKADAMASGPGMDLGAVMRATDVGPAAAYVARMLVEDSPSVDALVDDLITDAAEYYRTGIESGLLRRVDDVEGVIGLIALWSLGALVLHRHMKRVLGVDLTEPEVGSDPAIASYLVPAYEVLGRGILTEAATETLTRAAR